MAMHTDPVCGMKVEEQKAAGTSTVAGTNYFFCSDGCKKKFDQAPAQYAK